MSKTVDERVVEMRFDNQQFERNVQTSMGTLDKLKQSLKLTEASKGLQDVDSAAKHVDMSGLGNAVESVKARFSALQVMGVTALANITNSAVNAGKQMLSALTVEPIKAGFQEYETQMNAVQTILANTQKEGTNVKVVNKALDELNTYADKTIYNFTEMTRNIGTFTAAGVKLDTSVSAIKGIANLAAVSGSTSQQASTAMYQLSQAIASGTVKLMDWNSVVNAGMGGQVFQDALVRTAEHLGTGAKAAIKAEGSFRESLKTGWLTTEVLTQTLDQFSTAADTQKEYEAAIKKFVDQGYSKEEAKQMADMAKTAGEAATKVKTFTQLIDTLKEALGSGWTTSWRIIIGDFEQARNLWTDVSDYFSEAINKSSDTRNKLLQGWADGGGRTMAIDGIKNTFNGLLSIIKPIKEAFREVFPPTTSKQLLSITENFKKLTEKFKIGSDTADKLKLTFKGVFSVLDLGRKILSAVAQSFGKLIGSNGMASLGKSLLSITASLGDFFTSINKEFDASGIIGIVSKFADAFSNALNDVTAGIDNFSKVISTISNVVLKVFGGVWNVVKGIVTWFTDNISVGDIFAAFAGGSIIAATNNISSFIDKLTGAFDKFMGTKTENVGTRIKDILGAIHEAVQAFTTGIKTTSVLAIAVSLGILAMSVEKLSTISYEDLGKSILAISLLFVNLRLGFRSLSKTLKKFQPTGMIQAGIALVLMAKAIDTLAKAIVRLSKLSFMQIIQGLAGIGGAMLELSIALRIIKNVKVPLSTSVAMLALSKSCKIMADALIKFGSMSWSEIGRGLAAMGGALAEMLGALAILKKVSKFSNIFGAVSILILSKSLGDMADALKKFGSMEWSEIRRGLTAMGGALVEVGGVLAALGKIAGFSSLFAAGSIVIVIKGLDDLADAFKDFGSMEWGEIGRASVAMGAALLEVAGISGALGKLAGLSGILGGASLLVTIQGLDDLANALKKFGSMNWDEIKRGLAAMGGALGETALGGLLNSLSFLGAYSINEMTRPLSDLADSVKKWKDVTVPEDLGKCLRALASGILAFTFGGSGANALSTAAPAVGIMADSVKKWTGITVPEDIGDKMRSLANAVSKFTFKDIGADALSTAAPAVGIMADSVKKWTNVTVPENIADSMGSIAAGVKSFSFIFTGGWSLNTVAGPLGTLADSVKKWDGLTIPEGLGDQLTNLATGIKSFSFAFAGGWSLTAVISPLGNLVDSIKKWTDVTIPATLKTDLTSLATGVKAFSPAFMGAWSLEAIIGPLGDLAGSIKKWSNVTVPAGFKDNLKNIADGIKEFGLLDVAKISMIDGPLSTLSTALKNIGSISGTGNNLVTFANNIKTCIGNLTGLDTEGANAAASTIATLVGTIKNVNSANIGNVAAFVTAANSLNNIKVSKITVDTKSLTSAVNAIKTAMSSMSNAISSKKASLDSSMKTAVSGLGKAASSKKNDLKSAGKTLGKAVEDGIKDKQSSVKSAAKTLASKGSDGAKDKKTSFKSAGKNLGEGLVEGINSKQQAVYNAGYALGQKAVQGEKDGQKSKSPSKLTIKAGKWLGEGLVIGMQKMSRIVYDSGKDLGKTAVGSLSSSISRISDIIDIDIDAQPTIRPVLDLSNVESGASTIGSLLNGTPSIGVLSNIGSINAMMSRRQNGSSNEDVISAIKDLGRSINDSSGDTYSINGITYSDGTEVSDAIKTLVRAARIERRT